MGKSGEPNSFDAYYDFSFKTEKNKNIKIKDKKNHKINANDLKVGDIVKIIAKKDKIEIAIGYSIKPIYNIKSVKIIGQDVEGAADTYIFSHASDVSFMVNELTKNGITLTIIDKNERPFEYNHDYAIYKKVKSEPKQLNSHSLENSQQPKPKAMKQKVAEKEIIATTIPAKPPTEITESYTWEEVKKKSKITSQETVEFDKKLSTNVLMRKYDWSNMYGELESGDYMLQFNIKQWWFTRVYINFTIDEQGEISYENPIIDY